MRKITKVAVMAPALGLLALTTMGGTAYADEGHGLRAQLDQLNDSGATGNVMVNVDGTTLSVEMMASGLVADQPHAAHIHYGEEARNECPSLAQDDANDNGRLTTTETVPAYGPIVVSLTTSGDTSPESGLAVDRFDTAPGGELTYKRGRIEVSEDLAEDITSGEAAVVIHGVDYNDNGEYDGKAKSDLDDSLPAEATDPATCGVLSAMGAGGADTGAGGTQGGVDTGVLGAGALAMLGGALLLGRRQLSSTRS